MSKKQYLEIIKAMLYASGLDPLFNDDYYQSNTTSSMVRFFEGVISYFGVSRDSHHFYFANLSYMESPSETLAYFELWREQMLGAKS